MRIAGPADHRRRRGASHDVRITVTGATTESAALACARAVAASNLLKCAIAGNDPNWGRIVSSLGTVPVEEAPYDSQKVTVDVNGVRICENGGAGRDRSEVDMTPARCTSTSISTPVTNRPRCGPMTSPTSTFISMPITKASLPVPPRHMPAGEAGCDRGEYGY